MILHQCARCGKCNDVWGGLCVECYEIVCGKRITEDTVRRVKSYPILLTPVPPEDGGGYYAECSEFPGILADGHSPDSAVFDFHDILIHILEDRKNEN